MMSGKAPFKAQRRCFEHVFSAQPQESNALDQHLVNVVELRNYNVATQSQIRKSQNPERESSPGKRFEQMREMKYRQMKQ